MRRLYTFFFVTAILAISSVFALDYYYDLNCPTARDGQSGHVFPLFDKYHDRYVYVTALEKSSVPILLFIAVGCVFMGVLVWNAEPSPEEPQKDDELSQAGSG
jgi:hypothetical protein